MSTANMDDLLGDMVMLARGLSLPTEEEREALLVEFRERLEARDAEERRAELRKTFRFSAETEKWGDAMVDTYRHAIDDRGLRPKASWLKTEYFRRKDLELEEAGLL